MQEPQQPQSSSPSLSDRILFWASFLTLIAAGVGFAIRGGILKEWGDQYGFTQSELGMITGGGLVGFGLAIIFFSFFADLFGYGKLMLVAFLFHALSGIITLSATTAYEFYGKPGAYLCLNIGMWLFALGNGTCEAVINPLTATLFPRNKTHWLNILHAGWPLGLILGALTLVVFANVEALKTLSWEYKLGVFMVPVLLYGLLMFNRVFPRSEARESGVSIFEMMGTVGIIGISVAVGLFGLLLSKNVPDLLKLVNPDISEATGAYVGWGAALAVWLIYAIVCKGRLGSLLIAILYALHALVGYVELGTDSWIINITNRVLADEQSALLMFIWTNFLMFVLRFFAGPIVHRINPLGLLFVSALLGIIGLVLLGLPITNGVWLWLGAVTIYGIGKTFYWPTLLGVISEQFPKGGALALGISGGVGMMAAGMIGSPGIGYKQDYFAVEQLQEKAPETYARYQAVKPDGTPEESRFPLLGNLLPDYFPPVAGLDNAKVKVLEDYHHFLSEHEVTHQELMESPNEVDQKLLEMPKTTLESDLQTIAENKEAGKPVEEELERNLTARYEWWQSEGLPNYEADEKALEGLDGAIVYGSKQALLYTAIVPGILAVGFLLLILYFAARGGYKQVEL